MRPLGVRQSRLWNARGGLRCGSCGLCARLFGGTRSFAYNEGSVFVITGPILERGLKKIGRVNKVSVPRRFFKIAYDETPPRKMIAFVLPNEGSTQPLSSFATTVDEVERLTGLDFFAGLADEDALEAASDYSLWKR